MKKLLILLFSILISFNSYGEWTQVTEADDGDRYFIDIDTIKEYGGYLYFWGLTDMLIPMKNGDFSYKYYTQGDCGVVRAKYLSSIWYKQPMGEGSGDTLTPFDKWQYPTPDSVGGVLLKYVCDYVD